MTALTDLTTVLTILKGSAPTNAQLQKVADLFKKYLTVDNPTNEQRARATLNGMAIHIRKGVPQWWRGLRQVAEDEVYAAVIRQAHLPANQPALLAAAQPSATAAGDSAEGNL